MTAPLPTEPDHEAIRRAGRRLVRRARVLAWVASIGAAAIVVLTGTGVRAAVHHDPAAATGMAPSSTSQPTTSVTTTSRTTTITPSTTATTPTTPTTGSSGGQAAPTGGCSPDAPTRTSQPEKSVGGACVPSLRGMNIDEAKSATNDAALRLQAVDDETSAAGVIRQDPPAGTVVPVGSSVTVSVSPPNACSNGTDDDGDGQIDADDPGCGGSVTRSPASPAPAPAQTPAPPTTGALR